MQWLYFIRLKPFHSTNSGNLISIQGHSKYHKIWSWRQGPCSLSIDKLGSNNKLHITFYMLLSPPFTSSITLNKANLYDLIILIKIKRIIFFNFLTPFIIQLITTDSIFYELLCKQTFLDCCKMSGPLRATLHQGIKTTHSCINHGINLKNNTEMDEWR